MSVGIPAGNVAAQTVIDVSLTPASVATITTAEQDFTVPGLKTTDQVTVSPPGHQAGVAAVAARVSAADTLSITFMNPTAGGVVPTAGTYRLLVSRPEGVAGAARMLT